MNIHVLIYACAREEDHYHLHFYPYIYNMYVFVCVCVCVCIFSRRCRRQDQNPSHRSPSLRRRTWWPRYICTGAHTPIYINMYLNMDRYIHQYIYVCIFRCLYMFAPERRPLICLISKGQQKTHICAYTWMYISI